MLIRTRRHYSEKAYVLSRAFVRTALLRPPASFEKEIKLFYHDQGRLRTVIHHARRLMEKESPQGREAEEEEEDPNMWKADAIGSLSKGAMISLKVSRRVHHIFVVDSMQVSLCVDMMFEADIPAYYICPDCYVSE